MELLVLKKDRKEVKKYYNPKDLTVHKDKEGDLVVTHKGEKDQGDSLTAYVVKGGAKWVRPLNHYEPENPEIFPAGS